METFEKSYTPENSLQKEIMRKMDLPIEKKVELVLVLDGIKPVTEIEFGSKTWMEGEEEQDINEKEVRIFLDNMGKLGLHINILPQIINETIAEDYFAGKDNSQKRKTKIKTILVAKNRDDLEKMKEAIQEGDDETVGKLYGYPETSGRVFNDSSQRIFRRNLPENVRNSEYYPYIMFGVLSKDNWKSEIKIAEQWMETTKQFDPDIHKQYIQWARKEWLHDELNKTGQFAEKET